MKKLIDPLFFHVPLRTVPPPWLLLIKEVGYEAIPRNARKNFEIGITLRTVRLGESKFAGEGKERGNRRLRQLATVLRLLEPYKQSTRSLELVTSPTYWRVYSEEMKRMVG